MKILRDSCLSFTVLGIALLTSSISSLSHQSDEESLKSALDAVTRKQRSLEYGPHDYYNEFRNFKYHPNDADNEEKFVRQQNQDLEDDDDDLEFLPIENGQLENIGGGYQNFNNKRLERALLDYLENSPGQQRETVPSSFRERERTGGHKRALGNDRSLTNDPDKDLAALFYKELQNGPSYGNAMTELDNQEYPFSDTLQSYYDRYRSEQGKIDRNKLYETSVGPMSWGRILDNQEGLVSRNGKKMDENDAEEDEEEDEDEINGVNDDPLNRDAMYLLPTERRNVNGRYPIGREYGLLLKRYPVTKRSAKPPLHHDKEPSGVITDPKVAKDLGALFGGPKMAENNRTGDNNRGEEVNSAHDHSAHDHSAHDHSAHDHSAHDHSAHDHSAHDHSAHDHSANDHSAHDHSAHDHSAHDHSAHDHSAHDPPISAERDLESTESPKMTPNSAKATPGQKEQPNGNVNNNRANKMLSKRSDNQHIELRKKSVDWSQYFGIDRRKKKAALLARSGTQDQDDDWMLQRYYKSMAENLRTTDSHRDDKDNGEKRDKLDLMDARLKNVKNLIVEDALKYGNEENAESQEVKDVVMARLAAAYSLEKMRRALNEFRTSIAAQRELMRAAHAKNNSTDVTNNDDKNSNDNGNKKRSGHVLPEEDNPYEGRNFEGFDEGSGCPELDAIERSCPRIKGGLLERLYEPCIANQICRACDADGEACGNKFVTEAIVVCSMIPYDRKISRRQCLRTATLWNKEPSPIIASSCRVNGANSCIRRHYRYRQRSRYYQNAPQTHDLLDLNLPIGER